MRSEHVGQTIPEAEMTAVSKEFFFDGMMLPVPIYLKINKNQFLLVGKKNEKSNFSQFHSFKNPQAHTYVRNEDYKVLMHYISDLTGKVISQKNVPDAIKVRYLAGLTNEAFDSFDDSGFSSVEHLAKVASYLMDITTGFTNFNDIIKIIEELPEYESKHSVFTAMVSLAICDVMKVNLQAALEKIVMGSLLHDVGMRYVGPNLAKKPKHTWTDEDNRAFENHPLKGVEMLRDLKDISNDVLLIIAEHHENSIGTGFPKRLRDVKISPLSRIVIVADYFSDLLFSRDDMGKNYTAQEAVIYIEEILGQPFNKQVFAALKTVVNKRFLVDNRKSA